MLMENATEVRKEWSRVVDDVVRDKPKFIKRTRDKMWFSNLDTMSEILSGYFFSAEKEVEDDGSITLSLNEIDLVENGKDEKAARQALANSIMEYAVDYYNDYSLYSKAPNRKQHIPYVFKALIMDNTELLGESIKCRDGKN